MYRIKLHSFRKLSLKVNGKQMLIPKANIKLFSNSINIGHFNIDLFFFVKYGNLRFMNAARPKELIAKKTIPAKNYN